MHHSWGFGHHAGGGRQLHPIYPLAILLAGVTLILAIVRYRQRKGRGE